MKKKFLSILLVLCMVLGMMPTAFADDVAASGNAAKVGGTEYQTLASAIAAAKNGDTVTLLTDTTEDVSISGIKDLTLDLGGKTLTNTGKGKATLFVGGGASVSVKNGSIVGGASYYNIQCGTETDPTGSIELPM